MTERQTRLTMAADGAYAASQSALATTPYPVIQQRIVDAIEKALSETLQPERP